MVSALFVIINVKVRNVFFDFLCKKSEKGMRVRIIFLSLHMKKNKRLLLCVI